MPQYPSLPTLEELESLTANALLAYAARSATRILPLLRSSWHTINSQYYSTIEACFTLAADVADNNDHAHDLAYADNFALRLSINAQAILKLTEERDDPISYDICAAAIELADAIDQYFDAYDEDELETRRSIVGEGILSCLQHLQNAYITTSEIRRDYELALRLQEAEGWSEGESVSINVFGPLWPWGKPKDWPDSEPREGRSDPPQAILELEFDEDASEAEIEQAVKEASEKLSNLHQSHGGSGLEIDAIKVYEPAGIEVPA